MFHIVIPTTMDDVLGLTQLANSADSTLRSIIDDIPKSCERQNRFVADAPPEGQQVEFETENCKPYQQIATHLSKDESVLIAYFASLGKLASNTPLSYGQSIDTSVATFEKLPDLSAETIAVNPAAQKIVTTLTDDDALLPGMQT
jgi:hypothetical protein